MEQTETLSETKIFNTLEPEQDVIIEGNKEKLPKYTLPRGERLRIGLDQIGELNKSFFEKISELKEGGASAPAELRAVMESVIFLSYQEELEKLRRKNYLTYIREESEQEILNDFLTPKTWRNWWWLFKKHTNQAYELQKERVSRNAQLELRNQKENLPELPEGEDKPSFADTLDMLVEYLPRMRKKRRVIIFELIGELADGYADKVSECMRSAIELEQAQRAKEQAEDKANKAAEMLEEFLKDSTPAPDETASTAEEPA